MYTVRGEVLGLLEQWLGAHADSWRSPAHSEPIPLGSARAYVITAHHEVLLEWRRGALTYSLFLTGSGPLRREVLRITQSLHQVSAHT